MDREGAGGVVRGRKALVPRPLPTSEEQLYPLWKNIDPGRGPSLLLDSLQVEDLRDNFCFALGLFLVVLRGTKETRLNASVPELNPVQLTAPEASVFHIWDASRPLRYRYVRTPGGGENAAHDGRNYSSDCSTFAHCFLRCDITTVESPSSRSFKQETRANWPCGGRTAALPSTNKNHYPGAYVAFCEALYLTGRGRGNSGLFG